MSIKYGGKPEDGLEVYRYHAEIAQPRSTNYANVVAALDFLQRNKMAATIPEIQRLVPCDISARTVHRVLAHLKNIGVLRNSKLTL